MSQRRNRILIISTLVFCAAIWDGCNSYVSQGEALYDFYCSNCHMDDGSGLEGLIPPLTDTEFLNVHRDELSCYLKYGVDEPLRVNGQVYTDPMEGIRALTPTEIVNILNYVGRSWGNDIPFFEPSEIEKSLENCKVTYNK